MIRKVVKNRGKLGHVVGTARAASEPIMPPPVWVS